MRRAMRSLAPALLAGLLQLAPSLVLAQNSSLNYCIDRCFSTFAPPADCPYCTGARDRCVEQCSVTAYSYGAIAYGAKSGAWGTAYQWHTKEKAESVAMANCAESGNDCQVVVWFEHNCGAVATGEGGGVFWGLGDGVGPARQNALDKCAAGGGKNCEVQAAECSR